MEEKVKQRGWVKNAAIIFLAVMLVLTFFSNTIMNRSLPEAATQYVTSGTINSKVRGTGTVTATENYEVIIDQSRKVRAVLVKVGDEVRSGDVLFILEEGSSAELEAAQENLRQLNMQYQRALINATDTDYARENRDIAQAKEALEEAQAKRDSLVLPENAISDAQSAVTMAQKKVTECQNAVDKAQNDLDSLGGMSSPSDSQLSSLYSQMLAKGEEIKKAENELETLNILYSADYDKVTEEATRMIQESEAYQSLATEEEKLAYIGKKLPVYMPAAAENFRNSEDETEQGYYEAYTKITQGIERIEQLEAEYDELQYQYSVLAGEDNSYLYNKYKKALTEAQNALTDAQTVLTARQNELDDLRTQKANYEAAVSEAEDKQRTLEDLMFALQEQQKADTKSQQLEALDLQDLSTQIASAQEEVERLSGEGSGNEVKANVNGIVQSLSVSAGHMANADTPLAVIEVPDLGYSLSFSVTNDQARLVKIGDTATVSNYYWGSQIVAELTSIKTDPQNPQSSKILTFNLTGDVTTGSSLTLSVGQKSAEYDYVVPNSAIRSDNNGSFVLVVTAKNTPLSTRYIATRVDVEVIASDDTNSAVTGALNGGDFVITTSNKPVESGDQVRLPDNVNG